MVLLSVFAQVMEEKGEIYICSAQSENLRNLEIALRILRILRLHNTRTQS